MSWQDDEIVAPAKGARWQDDEIVTPARPGPAVAIPTRPPAPGPSPAPGMESGPSGMNPLNIAGGVVEPLLKGVTGFVARPLGQTLSMLHGGADILSGGKLGGYPSDKIVKNVEESLTYQPRTQAGRSDYNPLNALPKAIGAGMEHLMPPEAVGDEASTLKGIMQNMGREVAQAGAGMVGAKLGVESPQALAARSVAKKAGAVLESERNGLLMDNLDSAKKLGLKVPNLSVKGETTMAESIAGVPNITRAVSDTNRATATDHVIRGILRDPVARVIDDKAIYRAERKATEPYREIEALGPIPADKEFLTDVGNLSAEYGSKLTGGLPDNVAALKEIKGLQDVAGKWTTLEDITNSISDLRKQSSDTLYGGKQLTTAERAVAEAKRGLADAIESNVERELMNRHKSNPTAGYDKLANKYSDGRKWYAQIQDVKAATNLGTGEVDFGAYARRVADGDKNLSGVGLEIGRVANQFPEILQKKAIPGTPDSSTFHSTEASAARGVAGQMAGTPGFLGMIGALSGASKLAKPWALNDAAIARNMPKDLRNPTARRSFVGPQQIAAPSILRRNP